MTRLYRRLIICLVPVFGTADHLMPNSFASTSICEAEIEYNSLKNTEFGGDAISGGDWIFV